MPASASQARSFAEDVREGLTAARKHLPPWYFYDALGSALFAAICELPEYYLTRAETDILQRHGTSIARAFGKPKRVIELGSGNARKTRLLFDTLGASFTYVPIDVDPSVLNLAFDNIQPIVGDFREITSLVQPSPGTAVLFLGSSIGNFDPESAGVLLREVRQVLTPGDVLLLGADLQKPRTIVEPAYDDALGVTAAFNLNLLARINRELNGRFDLSSFAHRAFLNERESRIEMHLVSRREQTVGIGDYAVHFKEGETIHTENSYKYSEADLRSLAREGGFTMEQIWTDSRGWFADALLGVRS